MVRIQYYIYTVLYTAITMTYNNNNIETTITMTTYNKIIMYHVKELSATAVSPRLSLAAPAGGLPTKAQTDGV
jgi:hypothetical protein